MNGQYACQSISAAEMCRELKNSSLLWPEGPVRHAYVTHRRAPLGCRSARRRGKPRRPDAPAGRPLPYDTDVSYGVPKQLIDRYRRETHRRQTTTSPVYQTNEG